MRYVPQVHDRPRPAIIFEENHPGMFRVGDNQQILCRVTANPAPPICQWRVCSNWECSFTKLDLGQNETGRAVSCCK